MKETLFEQQLMHGVYALGRQSNQLVTEKRNLVRQLRRVQHAARLANVYKKQEAGAVLFGSVGAVLVIMYDTKNAVDTWWLATLGFLLMLFAGGIILRRQKMAKRIKKFDDRFRNWKN